MVGVMFAGYLLGKLTGLPGLMILFVPDVLVGFQAWRIDGLLREGATVKGNAVLEFAYPFLSPLVGVLLLALVWSVVFALLSLLVMIPLRLEDEKRRPGRKICQPGRPISELSLPE